FFFFFQAEDGIRDRNVTGVQTCALPISFFLELVVSAATENVAGILPIALSRSLRKASFRRAEKERRALLKHHEESQTHAGVSERDRKSTRLNSSHVSISFAVLCLTIKTL